MENLEFTGMAKKQEAGSLGLAESEKSKENIYESSENLANYISQEGIKNIFFLDNSARQAYVGLKEIWKKEHTDEAEPGIYFINPEPLKYTQDFDELAEEFAKKFKAVDKNEKLLIYDVCVHTANTILTTQEFFNKMGFTDARIAITSVSENCSPENKAKLDLICLDGRAKIKNVRLNVGANFQARIIETNCSKTISRMTGLEIGDRVQIYPNTVNSHLPNSKVKTVAVRKISNYLASGHFFVLPIACLNLSEDQINLITQINVSVGKMDPHVTFIKQGACSEILERATGLSNGCRVKFYPYSVDVCIEEEDAVFTVSPLVTVAVRQFKNGQTVGNFILMDVADLNLNSAQQEELRDVILDGLASFAQQESLNHKDAKFLFKKLKKELSFLSEQAVLELTEN